MPTKFHQPALPAANAPAQFGKRATAERIKAAQRDFYVLVGVFLASLTATGLAIALAAAIMLADGNL